MKYPFPRPSKYKLRVRKSKTGHGLFSEDEIPKRRFVIEYWGKIVNDEEAQKIGGRYLFDLEKGKTINGANRENIARYINHSCRANCEARQIGNRIFIISVKNIKPGDEITYDYGKEYVGSYIKPYGCRCAPCEKKPKK
jgi:SET domain-containing protein